MQSTPRARAQGRDFTSPAMPWPCPFYTPPTPPHPDLSSSFLPDLSRSPLFYPLSPLTSLEVWLVPCSLTACSCSYTSRLCFPRLLPASSPPQLPSSPPSPLNRWPPLLLSPLQELFEILRSASSLRYQRSCAGLSSCLFPL